jgi:hypothetical protein
MNGKSQYLIVEKEEEEKNTCVHLKQLQQKK